MSCRASSLVYRLAVSKQSSTRLQTRSLPLNSLDLRCGALRRPCRPAILGPAVMSRWRKQWRPTRRGRSHVLRFSATVQWATPLSTSSTSLSNGPGLVALTWVMPTFTLLVLLSGSGSDEGGTVATSLLGWVRPGHSESLNLPFPLHRSGL